MIALKITNVKQFMGKLLGGEDFDSFLLEEATISTYNTFHIDGHQNRDFYTSEEWEDKEMRPYDFTKWKTIRPVCFDLIKGRRTPAAFQFVLHLIPEYVASVLKKGDTGITPQQVKAFVVNDITNFCFRLLQEPYTVAPARPKTKFLMSLTI
ncbi:MAG: hypothetical protein HFI60_07070 [Lachnospiraceae bacterium]|nr:hypothetical protein [Lachnospiraceae bacterium]